VSAGSGSACLEWTTRVPRNRPSTTIGLPTHDFTPTSRRYAAIGPGMPSKSSMRAARPVSAMIVGMSPRSSGKAAAIPPGARRSDVGPTAAQAATGTEPAAS
jgi:hypothetical protein